MKRETAARAIWACFSSTSFAFLVWVLIFIRVSAHSKFWQKIFVASFLLVGAHSNLNKIFCQEIFWRILGGKRDSGVNLFPRRGLIFVSFYRILGHLLGSDFIFFYPVPLEIR